MKSFFLNMVEKKLIIGFSYKAGRNFLGRKTIFTQGGGNFSKFYLLDFKRNLPFSFKLLNIYKDFNRNNLIGFVCYETGVFSYILLSDNKFSIGGLFDGFKLKKKLELGDSTFLGNIELGNKVHHLELKPSFGAKLVRSAGTKAVVVSRDSLQSMVKLPSGWLVKLSNFCTVLYGNMAQNTFVKFNAGKVRNMGFRPRVRGVAMNPCDHPHGGGEGKKTKPSAPKTPWGKLTNSHTKRTKIDYFLRKKFLLKKKKKKDND